MTIRVGDPEIPARLLQVLARGGIAVMPCDTIYGLVGRVPDSEQRLRAVKGRGESSPFLQLIPEPGWVARLSDAVLPPSLAAYWPGPLTVVFPARGGGTVALRVPDSPLLQRLARDLDAPLYSTSVNRSGSPALWRISDIRREFEGSVDLVLDAGDLPAGIPSTIVDATSRPMRILREGAAAVPLEDLEG